MNATSIGEQLKTAREARGLSVEYVADETNIAKRYIAAMESEDFSVFPGDPYIVGFLRNYAEYLGVDGAAIVQAFRGIRLQEQPVPIHELLKPKAKPVWPFIAAGAAAAIAVGAFVALGSIDKADQQNLPSLAKSEPVQHSMDGETFEKRLYEGDSVLVKYSGDAYRLTIAAIDERVAIETPVGATRFMLGEEGSIDLDKDNQPELTAFIADFQKNDPGKGAVVRLTAAGSLAAALKAGDGSAAEPSAQAAAAAAPAAQAAPAPASPAPIPAAPERPSKQESIVFSGKRSPHPFVVNLTFRNYAMFRHEIDRKDREERYYHKGEQISVTANNSAKLWASNAGACKLTIQASGGQSVDVELGSPGEVAVKQVRWVQVDDGTWSLGVYDVN